MNRREERREDEAAAAAPAAAQQSEQPAPAGGEDTVTQLQELTQLHESGALTDEEFAAAKAKLLG